MNIKNKLYIIRIFKAKFFEVAISLPVGAYQFKIAESAPPDAPVGRIKATDADVGENAEMKYSITEGDGLEMFGVVTDKETQEGILTVKKVFLPSVLL